MTLVYGGAGGEFKNIGGQPRNRFGAVTVYVGGSFTGIGGEIRRGFAIFDP